MKQSQSPQIAETSAIPEILSRKATAQLLGINLSTLWAWSRTGKVRSYGIGNKVYYKYSEIISISLIPLN
jgi:predicted site-specific integrase-resolvase